MGPDTTFRFVLSYFRAFVTLFAIVGCENGANFTILGYTTAPTFDSNIRTVYVPIPLNVTYTKNIEFELQQSVLTELNQRSGAPRVTSERCRADSELIMKIVTPLKSTILLNQNGEVREAELSYKIEVEWRDLRPGHIGDVLSNPKRFDPNELPLPGEAKAEAPKAIPLPITPVGVYAPEVGGSNISATSQACRRAAKQIVNMMEVWR